MAPKIRGCLRKKKYTEESAEEAIGSRRNIQKYQCKWCGKWHLTKYVYRNA